MKKMILSRNISKLHCYRRITVPFHLNPIFFPIQVFSDSTNQRHARDFMSFTDTHVLEYIKHLGLNAEFLQKLECQQESSLSPSEISSFQNTEPSDCKSVSSTSLGLQKILPSALEGIATSYKFQNRVIELLGARGIDVVAWRVTGTSKLLQQQWAIDGPVTAPVFSNMLYKDEDEVSLNRHKIKQMEVNFAFRLGKDLDFKDFLSIERDKSDTSTSMDLSKIPVSRILSYVDMFYPVIDFTGSRFRTQAPHSSALVADMVNGAAAVIGTGVPVEKWVNYSLEEFPCVLFREDEPVATGKGDAVLQNPLTSILYLAQNNHAFRQCQVANKGTIIFSGPCTLAIPSQAGRFIAHFGPLGKVTVNIIS